MVRDEAQKKRMAKWGQNDKTPQQISKQSLQMLPVNKRRPLGELTQNKEFKIPAKRNRAQDPNEDLINLTGGTSNISVHQKIQRVCVIDKQMAQVFRQIQEIHKELERPQLTDPVSKFLTLFLEKKELEEGSKLNTKIFLDLFLRIFDHLSDSNLKNWLSQLHSFDMFVYMHFCRLKEQIILQNAQLLQIPEQPLNSSVFDKSALGIKNIFSSQKKNDQKIPFQNTGVSPF
jgi:hypothetical protein